jgi:hypothetical protein
MSVREEIRMYLTDRGILRATFAVPVVLGLALLAMWPRGTLEAALRTGAVTDTFPVALLYLGARWGAEDFAADPGVQLREYVTLTPVPLFSLVAGRLAAGAVHTLMVLFLGAPFLVAAMAVGGAGVPETLQALAVIGAAGLAARMCGLLALTLLGARGPFRRGLLFVFLAAALAVTFFFAPAVSPLRALATLLKPAEGSPSSIAAAAAGLGAAVLLAAGALAALSGTRARAARRAPVGAGR